MFLEQFSTKARDLLISPENNSSNKDRLALLKELKELLSFLGTTNIEIGEYSCYVENRLGSKVLLEVFLNAIPKETVTVTVYTPIRGRRTVNLESSETMLPKSSCYETISIHYKSSYLERQIRELIGNWPKQKPVDNYDLEQNIQNTWKRD